MNTINTSLLDISFWIERDSLCLYFVLAFRINTKWTMTQGEK